MKFNFIENPVSLDLDDKKFIDIVDENIAPKIESFLRNREIGYEPYLFMNAKTLGAIIPSRFFSTDTFSMVKNKKLYRYRGYLVFEHDNLKFGEVEIR